jgi:hypothetical protein
VQAILSHHINISDSDREILERGIVIDNFLRDSSSQLTYIGLLYLHQHINERQVLI